MKKVSCLSQENKQNIFARIVRENQNLIFEMRSCTPENFQQYDSKFNLLLEANFAHEEHEHSLRTSKENIKNSLQISDSWMTQTEVNSLVRLSSGLPIEATDGRKFVPKYRR